jgi:uncharacterized protein (DUF302 family)
VNIVEPETMELTQGIITKTSQEGVDAAVARLLTVIEDKGVKVFAVIDHSGEAARVRLDMPNTKLVIFGSPLTGTPVMQAAPLAALDLPLKVLVWADAGGVTRLSYNSVDYLAARHNLDPGLRSRLEAIDAVTDAVASPSR